MAADYAKSCRKQDSGGGRAPSAMPAVRRSLPRLVRAAHLGATPAAKPLLVAVQHLGKINSSGSKLPVEFVPTGWQAHVVVDGVVDPKAWTLCLVDRMRAALRRRDLFATPSLRYADPRLGLLDGMAWEAARPAVCRSLGVSASGPEEVARMAARLDRVRMPLVIDNWDDLLRLAGSLKLGLVQAGGLIRTLQTNDRPTKLARTLEEWGRVVKSLYLLAYIDNESYRRRILAQLNRGEGRHQLARAVFHGKRGELRQRYREGQEDQLGALGLVVNVIVLWNTLYMDAALARLRADGHQVRDEDVARLSPLSFEHINMLGRYAFILPDTIARGELRPLRDPASASSESEEPVLT